MKLVKSVASCRRIQAVLAMVLLSPTWLTMVVIRCDYHFVDISAASLEVQAIPFLVAGFLVESSGHSNSTQGPQSSGALIVSNPKATGQSRSIDET